MFKLASHSTDTSPEMSSPFVSHLIDNCLLYTRPNRTQTLLQLVFQSLKNHSKWSFSILLFKFFHGFVSSNSSKSYRFLKIKCDSLCTDPFPLLASSDVDAYNGNKVSWDPVLSKFISYIPEDCRHFVNMLNQKLLIFNNICLLFENVTVYMIQSQHKS